jgi:hypothetical protein
MVFVNARKSCDVVHTAIKGKGFKCTVLHGGKSQVCPLNAPLMRPYTCCSYKRLHVGGSRGAAPHTPHTRIHLIH